MSVQITKLSGGEWREATQSFLTPLQQSFEFGEVCRKMGRGVCRIRLEVENEAGYAQILTRKFFGRPLLALLSRGLLSERAVDVSFCFYNALRISDVFAPLCPLVVTPNAPIAVNGISLMTSATVAELSLRSEDKQLANLHGKWRNRLGIPLEKGAKVDQKAPSMALIEFLLAREAELQASRRYRNFHPNFLRIWARFFPDQTHVIDCSIEGEVVAGMIFLRHDRVATYHLGWRKADLRGAVHNKLLWRAMRELSNRGVERLDLGVLDTQNAPGLARFKLGTGAKPRTLGETTLVSRKLN